MSDSRPHRRLLLGGAVLAVLAAISWMAMREIRERRERRGTELAARICGACHQVPRPDLLARDEWKYVLAKMGFLLGKDTRREEPDPVRRENLDGAYRFLAAGGFVSATPAITDADWGVLQSHYLERAPPWGHSGTALPPVIPGARFTVIPNDYVPPGGIISMVKIDEVKKTVFVGNVDSPRTAPELAILSAQGKLTQSIALESPPVDLIVDGEYVQMALMGSFFPVPGNQRTGTYVRARLDGQGTPRVLIAGMVRGANTLITDFDGDGRADVLFSGFGIGRPGAGGVMAYLSEGSGRYTERVLWAQPGVVRIEFRDLDGDGKPELVALAAGAREGIYVLPWRAGAVGEPVPVFEGHPAFGFTHMLIADFDHDGRSDILTVNGDNTEGDYHFPPRPYHGVRIFRNLGGLKFEQAFFYAMPGASTAVARDFDGDGNLDVAVAAAYPDFASDAPVGFVLLYQDCNRGSWQESPAPRDLASPGKAGLCQRDRPLKFRASTLAAAANGKWLTIDAGDLDGDGDADIVLGGLANPLGVDMTNPKAAARLREFVATERPVMFLRNDGKHP